MPYTLSAYGLSDTGLVRKNNEDVWGSLPQHHLFVLADGMGGHQAGEVAAREATLYLMNHMKDALEQEKSDRLSRENAKELICNAIEETNHFVFQLSRTHELLRGMGTTLLCLYFHQDAVIYAHVGDSRIYRLRKETFEQLTQDHSLLTELIDLGQVSEEKIPEYGFKNIITRAIGTEPFVEPTVESENFHAGDLYLLCSDGLTDLLSNDEIAQVLKEEDLTVEEKVRTLIASAKRRGGHDNVTCVCVQVKEVDVSHIS